MVVPSPKGRSGFYTAFELNSSLYLFAQNRAGTAMPGDGQERIVCYGCKIWANDA